MPVRETVEITGMAEFLACLGFLDSRQARSVAIAASKSAGDTILEPAIKAEIYSSTQRGPHSSAKIKARRGQGGPLAESVRAKVAKQRRGEMAAVSVGPRAWYKHFPIQGTRPHVIVARDAAGNRADSRQVTAINALARGGRMPLLPGQTRGGIRATPQQALHWGSIYVNRVNHPGAKSNDFVGRGTRATAGPITNVISRELMSHIQAIANRPRRRRHP